MAVVAASLTSPAPSLATSATSAAASAGECRTHVADLFLALLPGILGRVLDLFHHRSGFFDGVSGGIFGLLDKRAGLLNGVFG